MAWKGLVKIGCIGVEEIVGRLAMETSIMVGSYYRAAALGYSLCFPASKKSYSAAIFPF